MICLKPVYDKKDYVIINKIWINASSPVDYELIINGGF